MIAVIWIWTLILVAASAIPLLRIPHGAIRLFSFGRQQIIYLALIGIGAALIWHAYWAALVLILVALWQVFYTYPFWPTGRVQSLAATPQDRAQRGRQITLIAANVKMSNRDYPRFLNLIEEERPDILVLLEVDADWLFALEALHALYPHRTARPQDNGYGMAVFADRPLLDVEWRELLIEGVPSVKMRVQLGEEDVRLYILHPEPPVPHAATKGRDAEIGLVGIEAAADPLPAIVTGDLNDVAWSHTTRRFQRLSGLLDPRVGRGFFNSFHAQNPIMRWPLDHLFHDARFRLVEMRRLPEFGSDHFAMLFTLALTEAAGTGAFNGPEPAREEDLAEIHAMAEEEAANDRRPIGEDWERV